MVSEALSTANCVKIADNLGHTEYDGRSCVVQNGFYSSDHCPVVLTFEPYWVARMEAHKKVLQAIAATDFVDAQELFDPDDSDDDMVPVTYDVHDELSKKVPVYVKKARLKQHFRHSRQYSQHLHGALGALTVMKMLTAASMLYVLPTLDKNAAHGATPEYWATHRTGEIVLPDGAVPLRAETLFDTGCERANYVSSAFLDKHKDVLAPFLRPCSYRVYFGDRQTFQDVRQQVELHLRFTDDDGVSHEATSLFNVLEGKGRDVIVGTPRIFNDLGPLFLNMISKAVRTVETSVPMSLSAISTEKLLSDDMFATTGEWTDTIEEQMCEPLGENYIGVEPPEGAFFPWRYAIDEPAPEDDLIPEADSHSGC